MILWLLLIAVTCYWIYLKGIKKPSKYPPGPPRLPLLGCIPFLKGETTNDKIWNKDLGEKYGPIVGLYLGGLPFVMITDPHLAKLALSNDLLCGRPKNPLGITVRGDGISKMFGVLSTDGEVWHHQISFTNKVLKDLGLGKSAIEGTIQFEANELAELLAQSNGDDIFLDGQFNIPVLNVLWSILAGIRFEFDDPKIVEFMGLLRSFFRSDSFLKLFLAILKYFPESSGLNQRKKNNQKLRDIILPAIEEQKRQIQDGIVPDNFIGRYLYEMKQDYRLNETQLINIVQDFFGAGTETISSTLLFAVQYLALWSDTQEKCFQEIKRIELEHNEQPNLLNRTKYHYINATIQEVFRKSSLTASVIPHRAMEDVEINGYLIPKDTTILTNMLVNNNDEKWFQNPEEFIPERFLDVKGCFRKGEILAPFGTGKRTCPGENLAKSELFIILTTLLQRFTFKLPEFPSKHPGPKNEIAWAIARLPVPYWIRFVPRSSI